MNVLILIIKGLSAGGLYALSSATSFLIISNKITQKGKLSGFICGTGLCIAHIVWASIAVFSLKFAYQHLNHNQHIYTFIASLIMFLFAYKIYYGKKKKYFSFKPSSKGLLSSLSSGLLLGFSSPSKILGYAVLFSVLGANNETMVYHQKIPLIAGVAIGNLFWWLLVTTFISKKINYLTPKRSRILQKISAFLLAFIGILGLIHAFSGLR